MAGGPPPLPLIEPPSWLADLASPPPRWGSGGTGAPGSATNPLTSAQANQLFADLAGQGHIPFDYPDDGCYARAHEMCRLMQAQGLDCGKEWIYATGFPDDATLGVDTPKAPGVDHVDWVYHVAPTVQMVGPDGQARPMVIDPSISDQPLTPEDWKAKMGDDGAKLESSDSRPYYRGPEGTPDAGESYDNDYSKTTDVLKKYSEARDNRREAEGGSE